MKVLLRPLKARSEKNMNRHKGLEWSKVEARLEADADKLWSLGEMEGTGGEPDVVGHDKKSGECIFNDCSAESPKGRRSVCYDRAALEARTADLLAALRRRAAERACFAARRVSSETVPFFGAFSFTPARRAFDSPIAIACWVERAPCLPSRM